MRWTSLIPSDHTIDSSQTQVSFDVVTSCESALVNQLFFRIDGSSAWTPLTEGEMLTKSSTCSDGTTQTFAVTLPVSVFQQSQSSDLPEQVRFFVKGAGAYIETSEAEGVVRYLLTTATLSQLPDPISNVTNLNVLVGGDSITKYRFKVGPSNATDCALESNYSEQEEISTPITSDLSSLSDGTLRLCVVGGTDNDQWQSYTNATQFQWTKETTLPVITTFTVNSGANYTNDENLTLAIAATKGSKMAITEGSACNVSEADWEDYALSKNWSIPPASQNQTLTLGLIVRDAAGNLSACETAEIFHDGTLPSAPAAISLGTVPFNLVTSPTITYTVSDSESGIGSSQVQVMSTGPDNVIDGGDDSVVSAWASHTSGIAITGLSLTAGQKYYVQIRGVDLAGNISVSANSSAWEAQTIALSHFVVSGIADPATAGSANTVTITAYGNDNNILVGYTGTVTFSSDDGNADLPADYTFTLGDSGTKTFLNGVTLNTTGTHYVQAQDAMDPTKLGIQDDIEVLPGPLDHFIVSGVTDPIVAGEDSDVTVTAYDAQDNIKTDYLGEVEFLTDASMAFLPNNYTFTASDNGVKTFIGEISFQTTGTAFVKVRDTSDMGKLGTQTNIDITPAALGSFSVSGIDDPMVSGNASKSHSHA